jgi:hypothetical protein
MVVFGGYAGGYSNGVWVLSLAGSTAWSALAPDGTPPSARHSHTTIYDPVRGRMVVFGGYDGSYRDDSWALLLAGSPAWAALAPAGTPPSARHSHTAIYDPLRDRMVVFGGIDYSSFFNDAWALSLAGGTAWSALAPAGFQPSVRYGHEAIYDPVHDRMVVFGGGGSLVFFNDLWALVWGSSIVSVPSDADVLPRRIELAPPRPNPSGGQVTLDFIVSQAVDVSLAIHDVTGRLVRKFVDGPVAPGRHSILWDCRDSGGRRVSPGVYLVRLDGPGARFVRKAVLLPTAGSGE